MESSNRNNHTQKKNDQKSNGQLLPVATYYDPPNFLEGITASNVPQNENATLRNPWSAPVYPLTFDVMIGANSIQPSSNNVQKRQVLVAATEGDSSSARKRSKTKENNASSSAISIYEYGHRQTSDNMQTTLATKQWFDEFTANKPTTPRPIAATGTQMATLEEEMTNLKQDICKLQDQLHSQENILQSHENTIHRFDQIMEHMAERIMALEKQTQG